MPGKQKLLIKRWLHICEQEHYKLNVEEYYASKNQYITRFANWDDVSSIIDMKDRTDSNIKNYMRLVKVMADKKQENVETFMDKRQKMADNEHDYCIEKHSTAAYD